MPQVVMFVMGIVMAGCTMTLAFLLVRASQPPPAVRSLQLPFPSGQVVASSDLDLMNEGLQATPHTHTEVRLWLIKTAIVTFNVLLTNYVNLQGIFLCLTSAYLFYQLVRTVPYFNWHINCLR